MLLISCHHLLKYHLFRVLKKSRGESESSINGEDLGLKRHSKSCRIATFDPLIVANELPFEMTHHKDSSVHPAPGGRKPKGAA